MALELPGGGLLGKTLLVLLERQLATRRCG